MTKIRHDQWIESLSAYLDGELSSPERKKLEVLLHENNSLLQQLNALEKTRALLRHAPRIKVPRNFTLTAAMLPQKQASSFWLPMTSTSSILAAVALIVTYALNLTSFGSPKIIPNFAMDTAPMTESMRTPVEVAPQEDDSQKSTAPTESPMIILWFGNLATGKGGGGGPETALLAPEAPALTGEEPTPTVDESLVDAIVPQVLPEEGTASDVQPSSQEAPAVMNADQSSIPLPEEIPLSSATDLPAEESVLLEPEATSEGLTFAAPMATSLPESRQMESARPVQNPILGIAPIEEQGKIISDPVTNVPVPANPIAQENQGLSTGVLILRGVLLFISLLSGTFAMLLRRRQNP